VLSFASLLCPAIGGSSGVSSGKMRLDRPGKGSCSSLSFKILSILAIIIISSSITWPRLGRRLNVAMRRQIRPSEDAVARARAAAERRRRADSEASSNDGTEDGLPLIGDSLLQVLPALSSMYRIILGVSS
jgi:hypothetical protein